MLRSLAARLPLVFPIMTTWHRNEYILKGLFLGLWTFVALQVVAVGLLIVFPELATWLPDLIFK